VRILARRFLASYIQALVACTGTLLLALAIVDMLVDFDAVVEGGGVALLGVIARAPGRWLAEALPLASFAAAFLAVALAGRRGELLALASCGIHPARATAPIVAAALCVGVVVAGVPERPAFADADPAAARGSARPVAPAWRHDADRIVRIGRSEGGGGEFRDLGVFELDARFRLRRWLRVEAARAAAGRLELRGAQAHRFDPAEPAARPRAEPAPAWLPSPAVPTPGAARAPGPGSRTAAAARAASVAVLAALALPLGLGVRNAAGLAAPSLAALALAALFRGAWQAALFLAEGGAGSQALAPWLVLSAFAALAAALWSRAPR
jgi:hypothetical protein